MIDKNFLSRLPLSGRRVAVAQTFRSTVVPAAIGVASRAYSAVLLHLCAHNRTLPLLGSNRSPFVAWDAQWYLHIARFGYHAAAIQPGPNGGHHDFSFSPGWPALIWLGSIGGRLPMDVVAVVLANLIFIAAAITIHRLLTQRFNDAVATAGVALLAFNPAAYTLSMAYSEPLFLLIVGLYFLSRSARSAPILGATAMLTRFSGIAIIASALVDMLSRPTTRPRMVAVIVAVAVAFAGWWWFVWQLTGSPTGWLGGSPAWNSHQGPSAIAYALLRRPGDELLRLAFLGIVIGGCLLLLPRHADLAVYGLCAIVLSLAGGPYWSMPRHAMVAFPAFGAIAERLGRRGSALLVAAFLVAQLLFLRMSLGPNPTPP
jgi:hypothetical protein